MLVTIATVPIVIFASWIVLDLGREQRRSVEQGLRSTVRALAIAVEREIQASVRALEVLATSDTLARDDLRAFHAQAVRMLGANDIWNVVGLADPRGQILLSSARPFGTPLASIADRDYFRRVVAEGRPAVSDLLSGRTSGRVNIAVAVPVKRDEAVRYILFVGISPHALGRIVAAQRIPADWISGVADRHQVIIARSRESEKFVGRELIPPLKQAARAATEGTGRYPVLDGPDVYAAWEHTPWLGWTVTLGVPVTAVDVALRRSMGKIAIAGGALAMAGGAVALLWGRRISRAMRGLASAAGTLGRGEVPAHPSSPVAEVDAVGRAMEAAGLTILERSSQVIASQRQLQRLVDSSPIGIVIGEDDRVVAANEAFVRMVGCTADALRPHDSRWQVVIPPEWSAGHGAALGAPRETEAVHDDGTRVPILVSSVFLDETRRQWASFVLDLTEPRRVEAERHLRTAAEAANRAKDEFLAIVSHELRTPLGAVLMSLRSLRSGRMTAEEAEQELGRVERNTQLQIRLIDDLLDLSRIVAGKLHIRREEVILARIVEHAVASLAPIAEEKRVTLVAVLTSGVIVVGDPERLQQIALNLIGNAVKFTPAGGTVTVSVGQHAFRAVLSVRDTGRGIDPELLPHIFEPFHQGSGHRPDGGLGLGLAIVRRLVEAHGGIVSAASRGPGAGAILTVELPARDGPPGR